MTALFTIEELDKLDDKQLHILMHAIDKEITTNPDIRDRLQKLVKSKYYDKMKKTK
jgi:hypothetical protein